MFRLIKQVFISSLSFSRSLLTKCVSLNKEPCLIRPNLVDLNPIDFNYYLLMISLDKCNKSCSVLDDLSSKLCISNEAKGVIKVKTY